MCNTHENRVLIPAHLDALLKAGCDPSVARMVYQALTKSALVQHRAMLPLLSTMVEYVQGSLFGILARVARMPLVVVDSTGVRWQTPLLREIHDAVAHSAMSDAGRICLRIHLGNHGLVARFCSTCTVVMGRNKDVADYVRSDLYTQEERARSSLDAQGRGLYPVRRLDDIPKNNMDLTSVEVDMINEIGRRLKALSSVKIPRELHPSIAELVARADTQRAKLVQSAA